MPRGGKRTTSFKKGQSGNPSGKPKDPMAQAVLQAKQAIVDAKFASKELTSSAIQTLKTAMETAEVPWTTRVTAAQTLLDRGWGKPKETQDITVRASLEELVLASFKPKKRDED